MATATEVTQYAKKFIGYNYNRMVSEGMRSGNPSLWCADFVAFILKQKGVKSDLNSSSQQFKSLSGYHDIKGYKPKLGDVFVMTYSKGSGHTGIVTKVSGDSKKWYITTIEGNSNNAVRERSYKSIAPNNIVGFWSPDYKKSSSSSSSTNNTLSSVTIKSVTGSDGITKKTTFIGENIGFKYELFIKDKGKIYMPSTLDDITLDEEDFGTPAKLSFTVLKDNIIDFSEGATVIFKVNGNGVFYGYVFKKSRADHDKISVTAYDQLRYFKNSETYIYKNKKASDLLKMICSDFKLTSGQIDDTKYVIQKRIEDNKTLFDIMKEALELTKKSTGKTFMLFDNFGYISLVDIDSMKTNLLLDDNSLSFSYSSSIDSAYNKVVLYSDNNGVRQKYIFQDGKTISRWGVLQKTQKLEEKETPSVVGPNLLKQYNTVTRTLSVKTFGNIYIKPGSSVFVNLDLGDFIQNGYMTVTKCTHNFKLDEYTMNLTLKGGLING